MTYTVLARRYRPQNFDESIGQEAVARTLRNAINSDRVAHAYLFTGTRGVGKTTTARIFAKALNCLASPKGPTPDPCGKCDSCLRIADGQDLDVIEIDAASNTGVDNVRELRASAIYAPARSRYKIYIIDEVHMLSSGAFNALLKTLEEPPEHVKFIFATTDPQKVPATIQSRCQRFDFRSVPTATIADYLAALCEKEKVKFEPEALHIIAREGRGSVRDALTILDQAITLCDGDVRTTQVLEALGLGGSERYFRLAEAVAAQDAAAALKVMDEALTEGSEAGEFLDRWLDHLRSLLLVKMVGPEAPGLEATGEERSRLKAQAERFKEDQITVAMEMVSETRQRVKGLIHPRPLIELVLVQMSRIPDFAALSETLDRLGAGRAGGGAGVGGASGRPAGTAGNPEKKKPLTAASSPAAPAAHPAASNTPESRPAAANLPAGPTAPLKSAAPRATVAPAARAAEVQGGAFDTPGGTTALQGAPAGGTSAAAADQAETFENGLSDVPPFNDAPPLHDVPPLNDVPPFDDAPPFDSPAYPETVVANEPAGGLDRTVDGAAAGEAAALAEMMPPADGEMIPSAGGPTFDPHRPLSRREQEELRSDAKVRRIVQLFDGRIVDMRRNEGGPAEGKDAE